MPSFSVRGRQVHVIKRRRAHFLYQCISSTTFLIDRKQIPCGIRDLVERLFGNPDAFRGLDHFAVIGQIRNPGDVRRWLAVAQRFDQFQHRRFALVVDDEIA